MQGSSTTSYSGLKRRVSGCPTVRKPLSQRCHSRSLSLARSQAGLGKSPALSRDYPYQIVLLHSGPEQASAWYRGSSPGRRSLLPRSRTLTNSIWRHPRRFVGLEPAAKPDTRRDRTSVSVSFSDDGSTMRASSRYRRQASDAAEDPPGQVSRDGDLRHVRPPPPVCPKYQGQAAGAELRTSGPTKT